MTKTYQAKVSYGLLIFVFLVFYVPWIPSLVNGDLHMKSVGTLIVLTLIFAFIAHLFLKTEYTIDRDKLNIKCGVFSYKPIDIHQIREISKTKTIISSPAPSFDRVEIRYGKFDEIIISPKDKLNFAKDLTQINPKIKNTLID